MLDDQLEATRLARRDDPWTSLEAARRANGLAANHRQMILEAISLQPSPVGATRIAELTGLTQVQVCRRLPELLSMGQIRIRGEAKTAAGRAERCWSVAPQPDPASGVLLGAVAL